MNGWEVGYKKISLCISRDGTIDVNNGVDHGVRLGAS